MPKQTAVWCIALSTFLAGGCSDPSSTPRLRPSLQNATASRAAVQFSDATASVHWNAVARGLFVKYAVSPFVAVRTLAIMSAAQYNAVVTAEISKDRGDHPSPTAAAAGASVIALEYVFPQETAALEAELASDLAATGWPGDANDDAPSGVAIGRSIGDDVVARAKTDNFFAPYTGGVPVGPGLWFSSLVPPQPPVGAMFGKAKSYFLTSDDQFRLAPPPAFGSPEYLAALGEVRQISDTRTQEQIAIAEFWALPNGTVTPPGFWNSQAADLAVRHRLDERDAAHLFAMLNMTGYDAIVACFDTKYTYWFIRPTQADPLITLVVALPNFPSYPSAHACVSGAQTSVIGSVFPEEKARLDSMADQAAISRVYGGLHYRFDGDSGLKLGRSVAGFALANDVHGHARFILK